MKNFYNVLIGCGVCLALSIILITNLPNNKLFVSFLDVGQGDAIYFRSPEDYHILIDAGPSSAILEELGEVMPLYNKTIDLVVLSHPHGDHVNGFAEIVKRYKVGGALIVGTPSGNQFYQKFLRLLEEKNIPVYFARAGRDIKVGKDVYIDVIWPENIQAGVPYENVNNASLSVKVNYKDQSILLTGDAEIEQEHEILESGFDLNADVFKAGHHGSRTASSAEFLNAATPTTSIIQVGVGNSYGHPHKETLQNFLSKNIEVLRTDLHGRINLEFS